MKKIIPAAVGAIFGVVLVILFTEAKVRKFNPNAEDSTETKWAKEHYVHQYDTSKEHTFGDTTSQIRFDTTRIKDL